MINQEERNRLIVEKLNEGLSLSDIQKLLEGEHGIRMTYMDLRVLAAELEGVDWSRQPDRGFQEKTAAEGDSFAETAAAGASETGLPARTKVTVSKLARPGAAMSGSVEFSSGAKAEWFLGNDGRLGLQPQPGSEKPTEQDLQEFQEELQKMVYGGEAR